MERTRSIAINNGIDVSVSSSTFLSSYHMISFSQWAIFFSGLKILKKDGLEKVAIGYSHS